VVDDEDPRVFRAILCNTAINSPRSIEGRTMKSGGMNQADRLRRAGQMRVVFVDQNTVLGSFRNGSSGTELDSVDDAA